MTENNGTKKHEPGVGFTRNFKGTQDGVFSIIPFTVISVIIYSVLGKNAVQHQTFLFGMENRVYYDTVAFFVRFYSLILDYLVMYRDGHNTINKKKTSFTLT